MKEKQVMKWDRALHWLMTFVGGFLGVYAVCVYSGTFGSAQTGNLMELMREMTTEHMFGQLLPRLGAFVIFGVGIVCSYRLTNATKINMRRLVVLVDAAAILLTRALPDGLLPVVGLYPIFFCTAFQWGTYSGACGYNSSSIFITNNYKQALLAWTDYLRTKDVMFRKKAVVYTVTVLSFVAGGILAGMGVSALARNAAVLALLPLALVWVLAKQEKLPAEDGTPQERLAEANKAKKEAKVLEAERKR